MRAAPGSEAWRRLTDLTAAQLQEVPEFSMATSNQLVRFASVHDGDSVRVVTRVHHKDMWMFKSRIAGIDTPELSRGSTLSRLAGRLVGQVVRRILAPHQQFHASFGKFDKYGRLLIRVRIVQDGKPSDLAEWLIEHQMAFPYDGGTKQKWSERELRWAMHSAQTWLATHGHETPTSR